MTHFHVLTLTIPGFEIANAKYENYLQSIVDFSALSNQFYAANSESTEQYTVPALMEQTEYGEGMGVYCGDPHFTTVWLRCEETCASPSWN